MSESFQFSDQELQLRFLDHWAIAEDFQERLKAFFDIDMRRLYLTIVSACLDIGRYKNYHLDDPAVQKSDAVKRGAYLIKWICRIKPLHLSGATSGDNATIFSDSVDSALLVNELFAIHVSISHLVVHANGDFILSDEKEFNLLYDLLYRDISEDALMIFYQTLLDHVQGIKFIEIL